MNYTLKHPIKAKDRTIAEVELKGEVFCEDMLSASFQARNKSERHEQMYLVFRMWGLTISEGERLHFADYGEMDRLLGESMGPSSNAASSPGDSGNSES